MLKTIIIRKKLAVFEVNLGILLIPDILKHFIIPKTKKNTIQTLNSFPFTVADDDDELLLWYG